ncbi:hypothetical protein NUM_58230 [Actinocatenispora comari]|uniref:Uncharacterized protein n=1 Tax=Actinocatenispora comari TaxID=2807577 RepID=A0A8J4A4B5_9ACTN|nr:hypothetical protein NUM_00310 [Actinocatenispora comari]GIL30569.1 hypothetical protein NUM_58230 [Actinocatenispora comari]
MVSSARAGVARHRQAATAATVPPSAVRIAFMPTEPRGATIPDTASDPATVGWGHPHPTRYGEADGEARPTVTEPRRRDLLCGDRISP